MQNCSANLSFFVLFSFSSQMSQKHEKDEFPSSCDKKYKKFYIFKQTKDFLINQGQK